MSEYHEQKTQYKDAECLIGALKDRGYDTVEYHEVAQQLFDWHGNKTYYLDKSGDKANIIVRRHVVGGAANDLGFTRQADGTYSAIVSEYDSGKHNADWMKALKQSYVERVDNKLAKKNGLQVLSRKVVEVNGKKRIQIQYLDPRSN